MTTYAEVREAMAAAITAGSGLRCAPYNQDQITAPMAVVIRRAFDPRMVFQQAKAPRQFQVRLYFPRTNERAGQASMQEYCELSGATSVLAAIQDGAYWPDDLVDYAAVTNIGDDVLVDVAGTEYLSVAFDVEVVW